MAFDFVSIGARLKEARLKQNLTQLQLANLLGTSVSYVKLTERGQRPSLEYLQTVVENCQVSYNWLLTGSEILIHNQDSNLNTDKQKIIKIITDLLDDEDPDIRSWAKIQIKRAFPEYFKEEDNK